MATYPKHMLWAFQVVKEILGIWIKIELEFESGFRQRAFELSHEHFITCSVSHGPLSNIYDHTWYMFHGHIMEHHPWVLLMSCNVLPIKQFHMIQHDIMSLWHNTTCHGKFWLFNMYPPGKANWHFWCTWPRVAITQSPYKYGHAVKTCSLCLCINSP